VKFVCGLIAVSHPTPSSSSAVVLVVHRRRLSVCQKIRTSAFYPLHPQISSAKFICNLPDSTFAHPHFTIAPDQRAVMLNYAGDAGNAGDGFTQDVAAAYPLIWSGGRRN